jgi:hypothetical protein
MLSHARGKCRRCAEESRLVSPDRGANRAANPAPIPRPVRKTRVVCPMLFMQSSICGITISHGYPGSCQRASVSAPSKRVQLKCKFRSRRGRSNCFQNHVLPFLIPVDRVHSCVRVPATLCKLDRTSLAIAGVRLLLLFRRNETDKTRRGARSKFPRRPEILRAIFNTRYRPLYRRRVACSRSSPFSDAHALCAPTNVSREFWRL